jgi:hypothetical protein
LDQITDPDAITREPAPLTMKLLSYPLHNQSSVNDGPIHPVGATRGADRVLPLGHRQTKSVPEPIHAKLPFVGARVEPGKTVAEDLPQRA